MDLHDYTDVAQNYDRYLAAHRLPRPTPTAFSPERGTTATAAAHNPPRRIAAKTLRVFSGKIEDFLCGSLGAIERSCAVRTTCAVGAATCRPQFT